jgi:uncharacterized protein (TIGR02118 family)
MSNDRSDKQEQELSAEERDRRAVLLGAGKAAALGAVVAAFGTGLAGEAAAADAKPVRCLTILYKNGPDVKFDFDYYKNHHMVTIMGMYGKSIQKFELRKAVSAMDGTPAPYVATLTIWIGDEAAFDANNAKYGATLAADVKNFTNTQMMAQRDEVFAVVTS